jgi:hypothetical protein
MGTASISRVISTILFLGAAAPSYGQVTTLNMSNEPNSQRASATSTTDEYVKHETVPTSPDQMNSLITSGDVDAADPAVNFNFREALQKYRWCLAQEKEKGRC